MEYKISKEEVMLRLKVLGRKQELMSFGRLNSYSKINRDSPHSFTIGTEESLDNVNTKEIDLDKLLEQEVLKIDGKIPFSKEDVKVVLNNHPMDSYHRAILKFLFEKVYPDDNITFSS